MPQNLYMEASYHLAQVNIARLKAPIDDPLIADFVEQLDSVNLAAERSPGFVWRFQSDSGNATDIQVYPDPMIVVNLSVWESKEALKEFTYKNQQHLAVFVKRKKWFEHMEISYVLWYIPKGHIPSIEESKERLAYLKEHGPSPYAFKFHHEFTPAQLQSYLVKN